MEPQLRCIGCGAAIQFENPKNAGYAPKSVLEKDAEEVICQRCFRLKHYNEVQDVPLDDDDFFQAAAFRISSRDG